MKDLQEVFNDEAEAKKEAKEIRKEYRDTLSQNSEYQALVEKRTEINEQIKNHQLAAQRDMGTRWDRLEDIKQELKSFKDAITDISINNLVDGQSVEVRDEYDTLHEPVYSVSFKKAD